MQPRGEKQSRQTTTSYIAVLCAGLYVLVLFYGVYFFTYRGLAPSFGKAYVFLFTNWHIKQSIVCAILLIVTGSIAAFAYSFYAAYKFKTTTSIDYGAKYLSNAASQSALSKRVSQNVSKRLNLQFDGYLLGKTINGKRELYANVEQSMLLVAGTGAGKSTVYVIPYIIQTTGPVLSTSNKPDVMEATYPVRKIFGNVYLFDILDIAAKPQGMWYDPLSYVKDEITAHNLANTFLSSASDAKTKDFWHNEGLQLLADYLLAAKLGNYGIDKVYHWITVQNDLEPLQLLKENGFDGASSTLNSIMNLVPETKSGIFATARYLASPLADKGIVKWIVRPKKNTNIKEFIPDDFVKGANTLYALSSEKHASNASALVTAITQHTAEAAEKYADSFENHHLPHPMLIALDEAANICKWQKLPDLYSYYRTYGITLFTVLQNWSQGLTTWGKEGMDKLFSTASIKLYLGGVSEIEYLKMLVELCGQYEYRQAKKSYSRGRVSNTSMDDQRINVYDISSLHSWPVGHKEKITIFGKKDSLDGKRKVREPKRALLIAPTPKAAVLSVSPWWEALDEETVKIMGN
jgi:type IV secretory pathway TraG/TraD family ATPase VirD4